MAMVMHGRKIPLKRKKKERKPGEKKGTPRYLSRSELGKAGKVEEMAKGRKEHEPEMEREAAKEEGKEKGRVSFNKTTGKFEKVPDYLLKPKKDLKPGEVGEKEKTEKEMFAELFEKEKAKGLAEAGKPEEKKDEGIWGKIKGFAESFSGTKGDEGLAEKGISAVTSLDPTQALLRLGMKGDTKGMIDMIKARILVAGVALAGVGAASTAGGAAAAKVGGAVVSTKSAGLTVGLMGKTFGMGTLIKAGGTIAAAMGSMFLGQWAQAEAAEPVSIAMREALIQAKWSGDWSTYDEAKEVRDSLTNLKDWEKILMWTPASVAKGIPNKIRGAIEGGKVMDAIAENERIMSETGEDEKSYWARINQKKTDEEGKWNNYYNEEESCCNSNIRSHEGGRTFGSAKSMSELNMWKDYKKKIPKLRKGRAKMTAKFWEDYTKEVINMRSKLEFGLF